MTDVNKALIFKKVPTGWPTPGSDLVVEERQIDLTQQQVPAGGLLTKNLYASLDPYMRGRMRDASIASYIPAYTLNKPITAYSIAQVLKSNDVAYKRGDILLCRINIEEYSVVTKEDLEWNLTQKIDNTTQGFPLSNYLGVLGITGLTAYASLYGIGAPKKGETIFISSAGGAVGQMVGQLAKHEGLTVIGSVGDDDKLEYIIDELGFDGGFNYKKERPVTALRRLAPMGIDIYYENVGGEQLEAALEVMNNHGRIVACGMISQYNLSPEVRYGIKNLFHIVTKRIKMQGFIVGDADMGPKYLKERNERISAWLADGTIKTQEYITVGVEHAAEAFSSMLRGDIYGKAILEIAQPDFTT